MTVYRIDPIHDERWSDLIANHDHSSVFHTTGWLEALRRAYGFHPVAFTTTPPGKPLKNGIVFCKVHSWLTGKRLVSLPFSDHCEPLVDGDTEREDLFAGLEETLRQEGLKYIEIRPLRGASVLDHAGFYPSQQFVFHRLDLEGDLEALKSAFHKDCVQRKIRRAEQSGLVYEEGRGESHLRTFYRLQLATRERLGVPPQPLSWFRTLVDTLGESLSIRIARLGQSGVAAIMTLRHKRSVVYKYGCSDEGFNKLGGMQLLLWKTIQEAKAADAVELDLGRTDVGNAGLALFKKRWGAGEHSLTYFRASSAPRSDATGERWKRLSDILPAWIRSQAGKRLYRHFA